MTEVICPKCDKKMKNLGNIDNNVILSHPPCWYETYVCHGCKCKKRVLVSGEGEGSIDYRVNNYEEVK